MHLYDSKISSGNSYKVRLILAQLGLPYRVTELDTQLTPPETQARAFLAKNPHGQIPVLELEDGSILVESDAILFYLAEGTMFLASDRVGRAQTLRWMFFEQHSHEPYIAELEFQTYHRGRELMPHNMVQRLRTRGQAAIDVMEVHLEAHAFFVGEQYGIADIALFANTQSADQIGLRTGSAVKAWLARVRNQPGHVPMKREAVGKHPDPRWS